MITFKEMGIPKYLGSTTVSVMETQVHNLAWNSKVFVSNMRSSNVLTQLLLNLSFLLRSIQFILHFLITLSGGTLRTIGWGCAACSPNPLHLSRQRLKAL